MFSLFASHGVELSEVQHGVVPQVCLDGEGELLLRVGGRQRGSADARLPTAAVTLSVPLPATDCSRRSSAHRSTSTTLCRELSSLTCRALTVPRMNPPPAPGGQFARGGRVSFTLAPIGRPFVAPKPLPEIPLRRPRWLRAFM